MNTITGKFNVSEHITGIVTNVFETMLTLKTTATAAAALPIDRISGGIGIGGERVNGMVYLHFPAPLAREVTRAMLQRSPGHDPGDNDVNDVIGELSNMIGCRLKCLLNDADVMCAVSTPSVIRGTFTVDVQQGGTAEIFYFSCLNQRLAIEIHLQLTDVPIQSI